MKQTLFFYVPSERVRKNNNKNNNSNKKSYFFFSQDLPPDGLVDRLGDPLPVPGSEARHELPAPVDVEERHAPDVQGGRERRPPLRVAVAVVVVAVSAAASVAVGLDVVLQEDAVRDAPLDARGLAELDESRGDVSVDFV